MPISIESLCPFSQWIWILRFKNELSFATDYLNPETFRLLESILIVQLFDHALVFVLLLLLLLNYHHHTVQPFKVNHPSYMLAIHVFIVLELPIAQYTHAHTFFLPMPLQQTSHLGQRLRQLFIYLDQINFLCHFLKIFCVHHFLTVILVIPRDIYGIVLDHWIVEISGMGGCCLSFFAKRALKWGHVRKDKGFLCIAELIVFLTIANHTLAEFVSGWCGSNNRGMMWRFRLLVDSIFDKRLMRYLLFKVDAFSDHGWLII